MSISLRPDASGTYGAIQVNSIDVAKCDSTGLFPAAGKVIEATQGPGGSPFAFRNKIINGNFNIWQRGTSQTSQGYGSADRWACLNGGTTKTALQQAFTLGQTSVPGEPRYFMRHVVTSAAGADNYCILQQCIESVRTLAGKTATLSFYAKANTNRNIAVEMVQGFGTGGSPSVQVTGIDITVCALTTDWQKFTVTVNLPSISGKALGTNSDDCLEINFWFDAGSNWDSRTHSLGQQSGTFDIAQVQLEGHVATPFEQRPIGLELALCQRYYAVTGADSQLYVQSGYSVMFTAYLPQTMRVVPTITYTTGSSTNLSSIAFNAANPFVRIVMAATVANSSTRWIGAIRASAEL
jgi:hypothetical protein